MMNNRAGSVSSIVPAGLLVALGLSASGFHYFAVNAFDVGTSREYIPRLKSGADRPKCVKKR